MTPMIVIIYIIIDINECESDPCHSNATCENTDGTFICQCISGYVGNGLICQGNI